MSVSALDPKLDAILARRDELQALLAEVPPGGYAKLAKEFSDLGPIVTTIEAFREVERSFATSGHWSTTRRPIGIWSSWSRPSCAPSKDACPSWSAQVALLLLPKDAADDKTPSWKSAPAPAATRRRCSPATCFRMYQRYADLHGWQLEIWRLSESDLGGYQGNRSPRSTAAACSAG